MGSLQDQLLKAGLTTAHQARVAKSEKRKQQKKNKKGATSDPSDLQKHIEQTKLEQQKRAQELNEAKLAELKDREQVARARQILKHHNQDEIKGDSVFNFAYDGKIKELEVNEVTRKALAKGRLAICVLEGQFYVLADEPARKIAEIDEAYIVVHAINDDDKPAEDDPYAGYEVPDDLMW